MKTYYSTIFICIISLMANANVQITAIQDKPAIIYVKTYLENLVASQTNESLNGSNGQKLNEQVKYHDGVKASGYSDWTFQGGDGPQGTCDNLEQISVASPQLSMSAGNHWSQAYVSAQSTFTDTITGFWGDYWNPYGNNYSITNAGVNPQFRVPVNFEHCVISAYSSTAPDWFGNTTVSSYRRTAHMTVKLKTGGKSTSKLRNLILLYLSANPDIVNGIENNWEGTVVDGDLGDGPFGSFFASPAWEAPNFNEYSNIPPANVLISSYGATITNSAGRAEKYLILPDNADVDITPSVSGIDNYTFSFGSPQKYHSYFEVFVNQPYPGPIFYTLETAGHAFWQFKTDAPADALQYIAASLTNFVNQSWGFYPNGADCGLTGQLGNDNTHGYSVKRVFYIGFPDLISGLQFTRGISNSPPEYCLAVNGYSCVGAAIAAGSTVGATLLSAWTPQNFGVEILLKYQPASVLSDATPRYSH